MVDFLVSVDALIQQTNGQCGVDLTDLNVYYTFDEASGNLINKATAIGSVDAIPNTDGVVPSGITRSVTGQVSDGYEFNGDTPSQAGNRISLNSSNISDFDFMINDGEVYTVNLWINSQLTPSAQGFADIIINQSNAGGSRGFLFSLGGDDGFGKNLWRIRPREGGEMIDTSTSPDTSNGGSFSSFEWHMLTVVMDVDALTADYYLDGQFKVQSGTGGASPPFSGSADTLMKLGAVLQTQAGRALDGQLDEVSIWRRRLTAIELGQLYALNSGGTPLQDYNGGATCFTVDAIFKSLGVNGCTSLFQEEFSTSVGWAQIGSQVTISGGTLNGWGPDGTPQSQTYDLQSNNGITLSDTNWKAEFKFRFTAFGTSTGHTILALADSSGDISAGGIPQASFILRKQAGPDPIVNGQLSIDDGVTGFLSTGIGLEAFVSTDLFVRLERISINTFKLSIATDFAQTSQLPGSPVTLTEASFSSIVGLDHIQSRTSTAGSSARNVTGTIDNLVIDAGCPTLQVDSCLIALGQQETFSVDAIVANINTSQLDLTWQYREHETNATFPPGMVWTDSGRLRMFTNFSSVGVAYTLKTFRLSEITGSDIKVTWERTLGNSGNGQIRVYDGGITAESLVNIPPLGGITNTLLGSFASSSFFGLTTDTLLASNINYAGATGDFITVLFSNNDGSTGSNMALFIDEIEVGTRVWDFTNGLVITDVRGTQAPNFTDVDDFGYINTSSVFSRFNPTFSIDARLVARTCSPWRKFDEADGSSLRVSFNLGDAQGSEIPPVSVPTIVTGIKCSVKSNSFQGSVKMRIATFPISQLTNGNFSTIANGISTNQVNMNALSGSFTDFTFTFSGACLLPGQRYMIVFDDLIGNSPGMDYETIDANITKDYKQYAVLYQDPGSGSPPRYSRINSITRAPAVDIEVAGESTLVCPLISAIIVDEAVWEFRETRASNANLVPPPNFILTTEPPRLRIRSESSSQGTAWLFKSFKKTDINGSSIILEGDNNGITDIKVYDGQYQRDRFGHFEPAIGASPATPLKGIGLLGSITANPLVTSLTLPAGSINYAGSTEEFITVFINNRDQFSLTAQNLDISAITMAPFLKWNFILGIPVSLTSPLTSVPPDTWISTDPGRIQTPSIGSATFMMVKNGSNSTIAQDFSDPTRLGVTLGTNWRLRTAITFSNLALTPTGSPNDGHFCVTDQDQTVNCIKDSANSIGLRFRNETAGKTVALYKKVGTTVTFSTIPAFNFTGAITHVEITRNGNTADIKIYSDGTFTVVTDSLLGIDVSDVPTGQNFWKWGNDSLNVLLVAAMTGTLSLIDLEATPSVTTVTEETGFGGETDWGYVRATSTEQPFMDTGFSIDACVGLFAGSRSRIGDIIILCLRAFPNSTGQEVVDHVNDFTENNGLSFVGTTSRVKNWMGFLETLGLIQEDNSDPDWYETKWISLI